MADPLDVFRQRERPGYFVQPSTPPRDITALSGAELDSYLRGFSSPPIGNEPPASPYSAQDLRLELARRGPATRRMDEGFEDATISNPPPTAAAAPNQATTASPANTATTAAAPPAPTERLRRAVTPPSQPASQSATPPPPPAPVSQQSSVLDMLRRRMQAQIDDESNQRLREIGIGMLRSQSPNFFAALGEGFEAADAGSRSRMDRLRQLAETERQQQELETRQAAQRAEEDYRRQSLGLRERELAQSNRPQYTVVGQDADGNAIVVDMRNPTQRQTLTGVTPLQVANLNARAEAQNLQNLARLVEAAVNREATNRSNMGRPFSDADRAAVRRQAEIENRRVLQLPPLPETGAAAGAGTPAPSQVLQYGGPRTNPPQQQQ